MGQCMMMESRAQAIRPKDEFPTSDHTSRSHQNDSNSDDNNSEATSKVETEEKLSLLNYNGVELTLEETFIRAAIDNNVGELKRLAGLGVDIDGAIADGSSALIYASLFGYEEAVDCLIALGADINTRNQNNWTPLHAACANREIVIAEKLIMNGADITVRYSNFGSSEQYSNKTAFECISNSKDRSHLQEYARTVYDYVLK